MKRLLNLCLLTASAGLIFSAISSKSAAQGSTDQTVKRTVENFASQLNVTLNENLVIRRVVSPATNKTRTIVVAGAQLFAVNETGSRVIYFSDSKREVRQSSLISAQLQLFENMAREHVVRLNYLANLSPAKGMWSTEASDRKYAIVNFHERVHEVDTNGAGNMLSFKYSASTNELVEFSAALNYKYGPKVNRISQAEAIAKARECADSEMGVSVSGSFRNATKGYATIAKGFGSSNYEQRLASKVLRYCYIVHFERCTVYIDADTGEPQGGFKKSR